ncbi:MAG: hypothetical protein HRU29_07720 [Rhizobiales bacterium]|nr:hypothetical protein [Hyphomicrobiales bacterium]NRB14275.1 hypothetical protein [Hyphomicrobiales bacterium]
MTNNALVATGRYWLIGAAMVVLSACTSVSNPSQQAQTQLVSTGDAATDQQAQAFRATQLWSDAYDAKPTDIVNILGYAKALASIGSDTRATKILTDGLLIYPNNSDILRAQAKALSKQGLVGPALRKMNLAIKNRPKDWRLYNDIGSIHSKMGEKTLALDSFKQALKLAPNEPSIQTNLGVTYMLDRQLILAEKHLAIAVNHPEATRQMRQNYAFVLGLQGKYILARKIFLKDLPLSQVDENIAQLKKINGDK